MPKKKTGYPRCYISIPRDFYADDIQEVLEAQGVSVTTVEVFSPKAFSKADYVIILAGRNYMPSYLTIGFSQKEKKRYLAIFNSEYKNQEWLDKYKVRRCAVPFKKTEQVVATIMKFIKSKGKNFRIT